MLLQDNQVRACIRSGVIGESVVWQSYRSHKVRAFHQLYAHKGAGGVHHTLRCDKSHNATLMHRVQCFEKEIIVDRLC